MTPLSDGTRPRRRKNEITSCYLSSNGEDIAWKMVNFEFRCGLCNRTVSGLVAIRFRNQDELSGESRRKLELSIPIYGFDSGLGVQDKTTQYDV